MTSVAVSEFIVAVLQYCRIQEDRIRGYGSQNSVVMIVVTGIVVAGISAIGAAAWRICTGDYRLGA